MKQFIKILIGLLLVLNFCTLELKAQLYESFGGYGTISAVTSTSSPLNFNFTISNFNSNVRPLGNSGFTCLDFNVGDIVWSTDCNKFIIRSISLQTVSQIKGVITSIDSNETPPINNTRVGIVRETNSGGIITYSIPQFGDGNGGAISGLPSSMAACIANHYRKIDSINLIKAFTTYPGNNAPPTTLSAKYKLAQGDVSPYPLYSWNGASWLLVGSGGNGTVVIDTSRIYQYIGNYGVTPSLHPPQISYRSMNNVGEYYEWDGSNWVFTYQVFTKSNQSFYGNKSFNDSVAVNKNLSVNGGINTKGSASIASFTAKGVLSQNDTIVSTNFTLDGNFGAVGVNCTNSANSITLPGVANTYGWIFHIRKEDDSTNSLYVKDISGAVLYTLMSRFSISYKNENGIWKKVK